MHTFSRAVQKFAFVFSLSLILCFTYTQGIVCCFLNKMCFFNTAHKLFHIFEYLWIFSYSWLHSVHIRTFWFSYVLTHMNSWEWIHNLIISVPLNSIVRHSLLLLLLLLLFFPLSCCCRNVLFHSGDVCMYALISFSFHPKKRKCAAFASSFLLNGYFIMWNHTMLLH